MDLVLSSLGSLKVESRLQRSLDAFIRDLSPQQRSEFLQDRQIFRDRYPDENDVFVFISKLNGKRVSQKQRSYGPRFLNIILVVQQFTAMGDILVGGSQNMIASAVWSTVRSALLVGAPIASIIPQAVANSLVDRSQGGHQHGKIVAFIHGRGTICASI
jgi:hypothetical protein